jgi:hypothetical protein
MTLKKDMVHAEAHEKRFDIRSRLLLFSILKGFFNIKRWTMCHPPFNFKNKK